MKFFAQIIIAVLLAALGAVVPARAQFNSNQYAGAAGGSANALVLTVPNWVRNVVGVPLYFVPASDNTSSATLIVNSVGSPVPIKQLNNNGLAALSGGEMRANQLTGGSFDALGNFILNPALGKFVHASDLATSALSFGVPTNLQLVGSVSANALTIAVKTGASGSASPADATATTPVLVNFRDATIANGNPFLVPITSALSITIASSNTMGCVSTVVCRLWIVAINNGGTAALCAFNALGTSQVYPLNEGILWTSASGTGGGSSAGTLYCSTSAVSSKAVRILGYIEISETVAGTWATGPTFVQLLGPGIKKPGDIVQNLIVTCTTGATANSTTKVATCLSAAITPTSGANPMLIFSSGQTMTDPVNGLAALTQVSRNSTSNMIGSVGMIGSNSGTPSKSVGGTSTNIAFDTPTASGTWGGVAQTYTVQLWCTISNTCRWLLDNGLFSLPTMPGVMTIQEIMGALPEPANDNGIADIRMIG